MHSVDGGEDVLHSPLLVELQLFFFVIRAAYFRTAKRDCTNCQVQGREHQERRVARKTLERTWSCYTQVCWVVYNFILF